jgi:hypothetical protein
MTSQKRIDAALNTPTSALQEIRELKARIAELENALVRIMCETGKCNGKNRYKITDIASSALVAKT